MTAQPANSPHSRSASLFVCAIRNTERAAAHDVRCVRSQVTQTANVRPAGTTYSCNRRKAWAEPSAKFRSTRSVKSSADCASSSCVKELRVGDGLSCLVCTADSNSCDNQGERADASGRGVRRFLIRCMRLAARARHQLSGWLAPRRCRRALAAK